MDDIDDVSHLFPPEPPENTEAGRRRLRTAIRRERRRRRARRLGLQATIAGLGAFVVWSILPEIPAAQVQPLLGLADAVERLPATHLGVGSVLYSKVDRIDLVELPSSIDADQVVMALVPSVTEVWLEPDGTVRRTSSIEQPQLLSPEGPAPLPSTDELARIIDQQRLADAVPTWSLGLANDYWPETQSELQSVMRRSINGSFDPRSEDARLLELAASLIRGAAADPVKRSSILRVIADIPGVSVDVEDDRVDVSVDYVDGDRPMRLSYGFDAGTAQLLVETLVDLASQAEPAAVLSRASYQPWEVQEGVSES